MFLGIDADALHYLLDEFAAQLLGSDAEGECQEIGSRGIVAEVVAVLFVRFVKISTSASFES
jgi:hypothetical protein